MPFNINSKTKTNRTQKEHNYINLNDWEVTNARLVTDTFITFTLRGKTNGVSLYGMRMFETKNGKNMIRCPQSEYQQNGEKRYANQYAVYISSDDEEKLMGLVIDKLNEQRGK